MQQSASKGLRLKVGCQAKEVFSGARTHRFFLQLCSWLPG